MDIFPKTIYLMIDFGYDSFQAPMGMTHAIKNTGRSTLVLFSTFSPPI